MANQDLSSSWHKDQKDSFHGKISADGPFPPEKDRYHLYISLFCPNAHRATVVTRLKCLENYAGISIDVVKPYPKGDEKGWPGWQFNVADDKGTDKWYEGSTVDSLYGSQFLHELYFKADPEYKGRYSVPVLWDKQRGTIVNNESRELLRDLQTAFNDLLPSDLAKKTLYPDDLQDTINAMEEWVQSDFNVGVYKVGFATTQEDYERNLPAVFASLNRLEQLAYENKGPYLLGSKMTEIDVRVYTTLVRFDTVYVQLFKCNLGTIRHDYPVLNNWLKHMYWDHAEFKSTTDFRHIKEGYTKSLEKINPLLITPMGPWPEVEDGYVEDWGSLSPGKISEPNVLAYKLEEK